MSRVYRIYYDMRASIFISNCQCADIKISLITYCSAHFFYTFIN
jgi:hypothetical protein